MILDLLKENIRQCEKRREHLKLFLKWFVENYEWALEGHFVIKNLIKFENSCIRKYKGEIKYLESMKGGE